MKNAIMLLLSLFIFQSFSPSKEISKDILGEWEYKYSLITNVQKKLETENHCPVERMVFKKCSDKKELTKMPKVVQKQRKSNLFKNISCQTYNNGKMIDKYYPVANQVILKKDTIYSIVNYGCKYKSEYYIQKLHNDTLIIYDDKNYTFKSKSYTTVRHIYSRKTIR